MKKNEPTPRGKTTGYRASRYAQRGGESTSILRAANLVGREANGSGGTLVKYDLHLHSCLSPCADDDMTPYNLVNMAAICGIQAAALTDHNTVKNCPAAIRAAEEAGILLIPGMELTTAEEIHVVCLFRELEGAMEYGRFIESTLPPLENAPEIFGNQLIMDEGDNILGTEGLLLANASGVGITEVAELTKKYGGICFPAHIDKPTSSILASLGDIPPECGFTAFELSKNADETALRAKYSVLGEMRALRNSDSHFLGNIGAGENYLHCEAEIEEIFGEILRREAE